jgi:hypothetical protein
MAILMRLVRGPNEEVQTFWVFQFPQRPRMSHERARGRSENPAAAAAQVRTAAAWCRCEERTDMAERRAGVSRYEAANSGGEALLRSTRSPGGGAWRRSLGMLPDSFLSPEDGLEKRLRPYFLNGFSDEHVKRSKKRPIYRVITSPKGTVQALIYLHRYNRDTVNRFLNDYLRPYQQKLEAKRVSAEHVLTGGGCSQSEKTKAQKRIDEIRKALEELSTWERDVVRPLAEKRIELDLDDGVKVNYGKLGAILAKVKGLNA